MKTILTLKYGDKYSADAVNSISSSQLLLLYVAGRGYTIYIK